MITLREMHGLLLAGFATFELAPRRASTLAGDMAAGIACSPRRCSNRCGPTVTKLSVDQLAELNKLAAKARQSDDPDAERDPTCARPRCDGRMRPTGEPPHLLMNPRLAHWEEV